MNTFEKLRSLEALVEGETRRIDPNVDIQSPEREREQGGSGGEHEINWGDVSDVVREALREKIDQTVQECMKKMGLRQNEADDDFHDSAEFRECMESAGKMGDHISKMLEGAFKDGKISKGGLATH